MESFNQVSLCTHCPPPPPLIDCVNIITWSVIWYKMITSRKRARNSTHDQEFVVKPREFKGPEVSKDFNSFYWSWGHKTWIHHILNKKSIKLFKRTQFSIRGDGCRCKKGTYNTEAISLHVLFCRMYQSIVRLTTTSICSCKLNIKHTFHR